MEHGTQMANQRLFGELFQNLEVARKELCNLSEAIQPCIRNPDPQVADEPPKEINSSSQVVNESRELMNEVQQLISHIVDLRERVTWQ